MSRRLQDRRGNGRFTRNTTENTFGLHNTICPNPDCRRFNPWPVVELDPATGFTRPGTKPTHCHACGAALEPDKVTP